MEAIKEVISRMREHGNKSSMYWKGTVFSYSDLVSLIDEWIGRFNQLGIGQGTICAVHGDYSPQSCAVFYALMKEKAIIVPFTREIEKEIPVFSQIAGVQCMISFDMNDDFHFKEFSNVQIPSLVESFLEREHPGLIVFSSGSTGVPKGILQDCEYVMKKFVVNRQGWRTVLFLLMDHFGGFNTLLSTFAYGGMSVCVGERTPEAVCRAIEESSADLLPTTPTFLNFLLASGVYKNFDLSSIKLITYGTELMSAVTLKKVREAFPNAKLKQTYGLSELGVLRSKSEHDDSVWVKIGGKGFETKIVDDILWVRSEANMVGYLNAPSPIDDEGWMCTGDQVEVKGEYMRFLGRKSEIINVGGKKVFPVEVETVLLEAENICEASVYGVGHPLLGQVVHARISIHGEEDHSVLKERLRKLCLEKLAKYKVPMRFLIVSKDEQHSQRFKKLRKNDESIKD
ncbi:long-chain fatty acid--CoA ligase [Pelosinus sp. sgz500959]|uniref:ANL family adenylate-forming protein n=1 Tax=Pelosinus sp. sgz500959 TaxID=3242472 RepID=UPI00367100C6